MIENVELIEWMNVCDECLTYENAKVFYYTI